MRALIIAILLVAILAVAWVCIFRDTEYRQVNEDRSVSSVPLVNGAIDFSKATGHQGDEQACPPGSSRVR